MRVVLKIRTAGERVLAPGRRPNRRQAQVAAAALAPVAWLCWLVCAWWWGNELGWTRQFLVEGGFWSHWQVWFVAGGLLHAAAVLLRQYAASDLPPREPETSPQAPQIWSR